VHLLGFGSVGEDGNQADQDGDGGTGQQTLHWQRSFYGSQAGDRADSNRTAVFRFTFEMAGQPLAS